MKHSMKHSDKIARCGLFWLGNENKYSTNNKQVTICSRNFYQIHQYNLRWNLSLDKDFVEI